ncbi:hypothetical protein KP509_02G007000 [Ceratopteris richardii]|uniref:Uncharacterized protein n=1 Tax=Ceratopteris richardii TaxID=49495 RepID=A0A8T2VAE5_CERRI|nr:hypothetical protein KP509_02G007000 [Ceratopteris richardii]
MEHGTLADCKSGFKSRSRNSSEKWDMAYHSPSRVLIKQSFPSRGILFSSVSHVYPGIS